LDGAVRGAFTEALCAALRAREVSPERNSPNNNSEGTPSASPDTPVSRLHFAARDAKALAAAAAAAARDRRETAFAVEKCGARAQTPIAVVAYEGAERGT
jgi:hypothetical protein